MGESLKRVTAISSWQQQIWPVQFQGTQVDLSPFEEREARVQARVEDRQMVKQWYLSPKVWLFEIESIRVVPPCFRVGLPIQDDQTKRITWTRV